MSRILLLLFFFCSAVLAQQPSNQPSPQQSTSEARVSNQQSSTLGTENPPRRYPGADSYYQGTEECPPFFWKGAEGFDLLQQCRMAASTEDMADWARWAFWLGLVGVFLLMGTLHFTRSAAHDARLMLVEARKATQAAIAQSQHNRAWISLVQGAFIRTKEGEEKKFEMCATFKNTGNSPAFTVKVENGCQIVPLARVFDLEDIPFSVPIREIGDIGGGAPFDRKLFLTEEQIAAINGTGFALLIRYLFTYRVVGSKEIKVYDLTTYLHIPTPLNDSSMFDKSAINAHGIGPKGKIT